MTTHRGAIHCVKAAPQRLRGLRSITLLSAVTLSILALVGLPILIVQRIPVTTITFPDPTVSESSISKPQTSVQPNRPAPDNLSYAIAALEQESDPALREQLMTQAVASVGIDHIPLALEKLLLLSTPAAHEVRDRLMRRWAEIDPVQAAAWSAAVVDGSSRGALMKQVALAWASSDLQAAALWVSSLLADSQSADATLAFAYEAARTDPLSALEIAGRLDPSPDRDAALVHALSQWAVTDFTLARAWVCALPNSDLRQRLVAVVSVAAGHENLQPAAELAVTQLEPGVEQDRAAVSIVQKWAQTSPEVAAAWVVQFPDNPLRATAAENLAAIWSVRDPQAAAHWIASLPAGTFRDAAMRGAAQVSPGGVSP